MIKTELLNGYEAYNLEKDILIVVHNQHNFLDSCLKSIFKHTKNFKVWIWDNGSNEKTVEIIKKYNVHCVRSLNNDGFIIPNNRLAKLGNAPYIVLLNSDTIVLEDWDKVLLGHLQKNPDCKIVGYEGGLLNKMGVGVNTIKGKKADYIVGWCLCLERKTYEQFGLFDEEHLQFAYCEDADLSLRIQEAGYKIHALHTNLVWHAKNATAKEVFKNEVSKTFVANHEYLQKRWQTILNKKEI